MQVQVQTHKTQEIPTV